MSAFMHDVAGAALPPAISLLVLAAAARGVLWTGVEGARTQRLAHEYLRPLCTWALVAVGTYVFSRTAAGDAGMLSFALPLGLGVAAIALRPEREHDEEVEERPTTPPAAGPAPAEPFGALWSERVDEPGAPKRLWSRS